MHSGDQHGTWPQHAGLDQQRDLQVGEAATLADANTLVVDHHAAANHQVHRAHLAGCDLPPGPGRTLLGGGLPREKAQVLRVQQVKRQVVGQAGHRHIQHLALGQCRGADRSLRLVGVGLQHAGGLPHRLRRKLLGSGLGAAEVGIFPPAVPGGLTAPCCSSSARLRWRTCCLARSISMRACGGGVLSGPHLPGSAPSVRAVVRARLGQPARGAAGATHGRPRPPRSAHPTAGELHQVNRPVEHGRRVLHVALAKVRKGQVPQDDRLGVVPSVQAACGALQDRSRVRAVLLARGTLRP
jgi:hypothetical protein